MGLAGEASALQGELVRLRRELHREPELGLDLPRTQERVLAWLEGLPLEISAGRSLSSVTALQALVTRRFDVFDPVVLTVGLLRAGTSPFAVPDSAHFEASARSFSPQSRARMREESARLCEGIAAADGLTAGIEARELYPVTVNDDAEAEFAASVIQEIFGQERHQLLAHALTASEDFSYLLQAVPGAVVLLGACPPETGPDTAAGNHSSTAVFDDFVLADGAQYYAELALRRLARRTGM